ncbi:hypothetical protein AgCh_029361 [Apium graveolens]
MVRSRIDELIPCQIEIKKKFNKFSEKLATFNFIGIETSIKKPRESFLELHIILQSQISQNNDTKVKLDQLHKDRYKPSALIMEEIKKVISVSLGAIMGALKVPFQETPKIIRAQITQNPSQPESKTKGEMKAKLKALHERDVVSKVMLREKRVVINMEDVGVDRCMQALETRVNFPLKSSDAPVAPTCQSSQAFLKLADMVRFKQTTRKTCDVDSYVRAQVVSDFVCEDSILKSGCIS